METHTASEPEAISLPAQTKSTPTIQAGASLEHRNPTAPDSDAPAEHLPPRGAALLADLDPLLPSAPGTPTLAALLAAQMVGIYDTPAQLAASVGMTTTVAEVESWLAGTTRPRIGRWLGLAQAFVIWPTDRWADALTDEAVALELLEERSTLNARIAAVHAECVEEWRAFVDANRAEICRWAGLEVEDGRDETSNPDVPGVDCGGISDAFIVITGNGDVGMGEHPAAAFADAVRLSEILDPVQTGDERDPPPGTLAELLGLEGAEVFEVRGGTEAGRAELHRLLTAGGAA